MNARRWAAVFACLLAACATGSSDSSETPDLVLYNGKIVTVDGDFSVAQAVAIRGERIVAVGADDAVRARGGLNTKEIDLKGRTVIPGLIDGHLHNAGGGPGVDLSKARSISELLTAVAARANSAPAGELIVSNADWHEAQLHEKRLPHRTELDRAAPKNPVVLIRGGHEFILNSAAFARWSITRGTQSPPGGEIGHDADGDLNGELVDTARGLVKLPPPPRL
ncbi:MAG TPA: amidohydrolase family protein, partial [Burkholderiales bacterium]|nr:amidohydrolase family protein [Burkholderiales bacterium]